jgi:DNA mismatch endonuclease (patch repair protein)
MDRLSPAARSSLMSKIRGKNTRPEMIVRSVVHRLGYRFRLHRKDLPGTPDLVLPKHKRVIFVNGCFWHWHNGCSAFRASKTRVEYWETKLARNRARDSKNRRLLRNLGWRVLTIWECEVANLTTLSRRIETFLSA